MINFRYHIVSLMAVFIALSVGIAVGVSLSPSVSRGLIDQAAQDRKQLTDLRAELERRKALDSYREAYEQRAGQVLTAGVLDGSRVVLVSMPDAPRDVVQSINAAVTQAGGSVVGDVRVSAGVFDPEQADEVKAALAPYSEQLQLTDAMSPATMTGLAVGRAVATRGSAERDALAVQLGDALVSAGLVALSKDVSAQAELAIVVAAPSPDVRPPAESLVAHVQFDLGLKLHAAVVVAGPNSEAIEGTDVLQIRNDPTAVDQLSTVDVADLGSGVTTSVLAGKEQLLGRIGRHYGALTNADAPAPDLPVR